MPLVSLDEYELDKYGEGQHTPEYEDDMTSLRVEHAGNLGINIIFHAIHIYMGKETTIRNPVTI